jgi:phenylpropionate dioxygenase-like ring-hydroxylating dioxygenase large terminal subunit
MLLFTFILSRKANKSLLFFKHNHLIRSAMEMDKFLNNDWHVIARSQDLLQGKILKARLLGEDLVLWRSGDKVVAWEDRCPHRGASLARGWIEKDALVCPYHGLAFNGEGQCVHIPAHPEQTPSARSKACVKTYHVRERYEMVWVCLGNPQQDVPAFPEWDSQKYNKFFFNAALYRSSPERALENFIDVNHVPFVHDGTLGNPDYANTNTYQVFAEEDGIHIKDAGAWQTDLQMNGEGNMDFADFHILRPLTVCLRRGPQSERMIIFFTVTPTDEESCFAWRWMFLNYEVPENEFKKFTNTIIAQDVEAVESQKPLRLPLDLEAEYHLPSDRTTITYRKWLKNLGVTFGTTAAHR